MQADAYNGAFRSHHMLRFNRSRAFLQAWDLGSRVLGEGAFSEERFQTWFQNIFKIAPNCTQIFGKWAPEASWSFEKSLVGSGGASRGLWIALGTLLEASGAEQKVLLNGSWPVQEGFQDGFQPLLGARRTVFFFFLSRGPKRNSEGFPQVVPNNKEEGYHRLSVWPLSLSSAFIFTLIFVSS